MAEQPQNNTPQNTAPSEEQLVVQQYAQAAGLDPNRPEHVVAIIQTLQAAAEMGLTGENPQHISAITATMQQLAEMQAKPEEVQGFAASLGLDLAATEQQQQERISQLQQIEQQLQQNEARAGQLKAKAGSRNIINYIAMVVGAVGGAWLTNYFMKKHHAGKDLLVKKVGSNNKVILDKNNEPVLTFNKEKGQMARRAGRFGAGVAGLGILGKISSMIFTAPLEREYKQLELQTNELALQRQQLKQALESQGMGFVGELTKRMLASTLQQVEQGAAQEQSQQTQPQQPQQHSNNQPHSAQDEEARRKAAAEYVKRMEGVNKEVQDAQKEVEVHPRQQALNTTGVAPLHDGQAVSVVKKQTGSEVATQANKFTDGLNAPAGNHSAIVKQPSENHVAAATAPAEAVTQPGL